MKKAIVWLLVAALTVSIAGCYIPLHVDPVATADVPATEATAAPVQDDWDISWKKAFRSDKFPEGGLKNDEVAFARKQGEGFDVVNIPQSELTGFDDGGFLPRYSLLEIEEPDKPDLTQACISYAVVNNYDRFVLPANPSVMTLPSGHDREYWWSVDIRCDINASNFLPLDDGSTLYYCLCVIQTPLGTTDYAEWNREQREAFEAAKQIIADMPEDCVSDYDKALYFYSYLTEHVRYAYDEEYPGDEDYYTYAQNLYYDTLISHKTVCAGYGSTFAWLCELAGLSAFPASGQYGATESHLWTMVKVDGGYYWFDPTWDEGEYPENFLYFGISDKDMEERGGTRHLYQAYEELLPDCPESMPLPAANLPSLTRGTISEGRYRSESLGLIFDLPDGWQYLNDLLIGQGSGEKLTPFETLLSEQEYAYDMVAINAKGEEIDVEVYRRQEDPSVFADRLLRSLEQAVDVTSSDRSEITFCGQTCQGLQVQFASNGKRNGSDVCLRFAIKQFGSGLLVIRSWSDDPERCAQLLDYFTAIKG